MDDDIDELMGREDLDLDNTERVDDSVEHTAEEVKEEVTKTEEGEETKEAEVSDDSEGEERAEEKEAQQTEEKREEGQEIPPKPLTIDDVHSYI